MKSKTQQNAIKTSKKSGEMQAHHEAYEGPIPHPNILKGLKDIDEKFPERVFIMAEKEQAHRHEMDIKLIKNHSFMSKTGLIFGFLIAILCIGAGLYLVISDKSVKGFTLILTPIAGIIASFMFKNKTENK